MKKCPRCLSIAVVTLLCGCMSSRLAYKYGDGTPYEGLDDVKVTQKFTIRSINLKSDVPQKDAFVNNQEPKPDIEAVSKVAPEIFAQGNQTGTIPIDVTVHFGEMKQSEMNWKDTLFSCLSLCSLFTIPIYTAWEKTERIEISTPSGEKVVPDCSILRNDDSKCSFILPFGAFKFSPKKGFQENVFAEYNYAFSCYGQEGTNAFVRTIAKAIAQQLKKHALDRITTPDVEFNAEKK